ncbi:uncharacterized protein [Haliotis asinina]|uniref:uncharacterized protein n=1 Tax=Haliotis asinina TaxID=109174 RepID=UPI003531BED7
MGATRILLLRVGIGVLLLRPNVYACTEGIQACFTYFNSRLGASTGICDLATDQLDCLQMVRLSCSSTGLVDGAFQGFKAEYEGTPNNCIFGNIAQSPDYAAFQCTKLFDDCRSTATITTCGLVDFYEICTGGLSAFCSKQNLQNATDFITWEKQRLATEQGCYFATTPRVLLSAPTCIPRYIACYESEGITASSNPCVAVPVYERCLQSTVTDVCDAAASQMVLSLISSKQSECASATTAKTATSLATALSTQAFTSPKHMATLTTAHGGVRISTQGIDNVQGHIRLDFKDSGTHLCLHAVVVVSCVLMHVVLR